MKRLLLQVELEMTDKDFVKNGFVEELPIVVNKQNEIIDFKNLGVISKQLKKANTDISLIEVYEVKD